MSSQQIGVMANSSIDSVKHSKEAALTNVEFESLYHATSHIDDELMRLQSRFVILLCGRMGLRAGEVAHMDETWINWRKQTIQIPKHDACQKGRTGGPCGRCKRLAQQVAEHSDDITYDDAVAVYWQPKTSSAVREISFSWNARIQYIIEQFFDHWDHWPRSVQVIARRIDRACGHCPDVDEGTISPHPLRATAASHLAGRGLGHSSLMQHFGWADFSVASAYIQTSSDATAKELSQLGRK